ncbi:NAD(P)/FAD-dependent oxidoreductase [Chryseolinea lacunae]|uniref:FAD-binding oxidoreductase n=1 Tax=Chryseolinea lacunae TaxID=2801331 RepID=A0ABS1L089_9BACT|nr:FAD-binding oxidoreductase [Chryseolinea lacunae]MBL0745124.1 FAD-binding oxidoreductase [Chryseolinea lacunae]
MTLRSKETYWLLKNGLLQSYPSLRTDISCDVLVVGGGITGALLACQLSGEGYKTVLIDKRDVSLGSTSATTALLQYEIDEPLYSLKKKVGDAVAIESYREGIEAIKRLGTLVSTLGIDCGFKTQRSLYIAHKPKDAKWLVDECRHRADAGIHVQWLPKETLENDFGVQGHGAILSENAASVDGYSLAHGLLAYAVKHCGLEIYDHTELSWVKFDKRKNIAGTAHNNVITSQYIVYATGYESLPIVKDKVATLHSTYAIVSEPLDSLPGILTDTLLWDTQDPYLYVRSTPDNRILIGGGDEKFKNATLRDSLMDRKEKELLKSFERLMPGVSIIPDFSWAGTFGITADALPFIGEHPDFPQSYFVLGFGGNGITFSVMGMQMISDAMAGRPNRFLEYFRFRR